MTTIRRFLVVAAGLGATWGAAACVGDSPGAVVGAGTDGIDGSAADAGGGPIGNETGTTGTDASVPDGATTDSGMDAAPVDAGPRCDPTKAFGTPVNEGTDVNNAQVEDGVRLSTNELELFLTREDAVGKRIYRYSRATPQAAWGSPVVEANLVVTPPAPAAPASMSLALDPTGLTAYLAVYLGTGPWQIHLSSRTSIGATWSTPTPVANLQVVGKTDEQPWINPAGNRLYFMSDRGTGYKIYTSTKSGTFSTPTLLDADTGESRWPVLSPDELTLYFGAYDGTNGVQIYKKTRPSVGGTWSGRALVPGVNGTALTNASITAPTWLSADTCVLYMVSNRTGGQGTLLDVWHATKPK